MHLSLGDLLSALKHLCLVAPPSHISFLSNRQQEQATMTSHPDTKIDCSKVYVKKSTFSNEETGDFDGAFAAVAIKEGESDSCRGSHVDSGTGFQHIHRGTNMHSNSIFWGSWRCLEWRTQSFSGEGLVTCESVGAAFL